MRRDQRFPLRLSIRQSFDDTTQLGGGCVYPVAGVEGTATSPAADENVRPKPVGFKGKLWPAVCERQNYSVRHYRLSTFVLPQTQALNWVIGVSIFAGIDRHVR